LVHYTVKYSFTKNKGSGGNDRGQLGLNDLIIRSFPTINPFIKNIIQVSSFGDSVLALDAYGVVYTFGRNDGFQLGTGDQTDRLLPFALYITIKIVNIVSGYYDSLLIDINGNFFVKKGNLYGSGVTFGPSPAFLSSPVKNQRFKQVSSGYAHSLILDTFNLVYVAGLNDKGQLGLGDTVSRMIVTLLPFSSSLKFNITKVSCGWKSSFLFKNINLG
jgi:alpha-tubulin suppressor-like RCC1 family protein